MYHLYIQRDQQLYRSSAVPGACDIQPSAEKEDQFLGFMQTAVPWRIREVILRNSDAVVMKKNFNKAVCNIKLKPDPVGVSVIDDIIGEVYK